MSPLLLKDPKATGGDHARCRAMLKRGSLTFHAAAQLLPLRVRHPVTILYAFCRLADDAVDHASDGKRALARLTQRLDRAFEGEPIDQPVDRTFADLIRQYNLPRLPFDLLFEGFEWDVEGRDYKTISDVRAYGVRVAGTVGVLMAFLMGARSADALARASDLGIAMQLTNIARDVGEDANAGRLYLPTDWLIEEGVDPEAFLAEPKTSPGLARVSKRLLEEADRLYKRSEGGLWALPWQCRLAIRAARLIYADIGRDLAIHGYDNISRRSYVNKMGKARLMLKAMTTKTTRDLPGAKDPACKEAQSLVMAAAKAGAEMAELNEDRMSGLFHVFEALEERRPMGR